MGSTVKRRLFFFLLSRSVSFRYFWKGPHVMPTNTVGVAGTFDTTTQFEEGWPLVYAMVWLVWQPWWRIVAESREEPSGILFPPCCHRNGSLPAKSPLISLLSFHRLPNKGQANIYNLHKFCFLSFLLLCCHSPMIAALHSCDTSILYRQATPIAWHFIKDPAEDTTSTNCTPMPSSR